MDRANVGERAFAAATPPPHGDPEAIEFVRFCYHRKRVGWPELYDEMCAVAGRGLYQGFGPEELSAIGIGFGLFQMPALAVLVSRVVAEDLDRRRRTAAAIRSSLLAGETEGSPEAAAAAAAEGVINAASSVDGGAAEPGSTDVVGPDLGVVRLAVAAGA